MIKIGENPIICTEDRFEMQENSRPERKRKLQITDPRPPPRGTAANRSPAIVQCL